MGVFKKILGIPKQQDIKVPDPAVTNVTDTEADTALAGTSKERRRGLWSQNKSTDSKSRLGG